FDPPRVVPGRHGRIAVIERPCAKHTELDLAVAHDVGVGSYPPGVAVQEILDDPLPILAHEVDDAESDPELAGDLPRVGDVLFPGAMPYDLLLVYPILHVGALDVVALVPQQERGDGAVDSAGHGDKDLFAGL